MGNAATVEMTVEPLVLAYPFTGRWLVQNSPRDRVPSHGTTRFASSYAIDFVPVDGSGRSAAFGLESLFRPEQPEKFIGFGRDVLAPVRGTVAAIHDSAADHPAYRGLRSLGYAMTQRRRVDAGWPALAGNHVMIRSDVTVVALCHLQQGSVEVQVGQTVRIGQRLGRCGNSGNSTEPHLHVQAISSMDISLADAVPIRFGDTLPTNGTIVEA